MTVSLYEDAVKHIQSVERKISVLQSASRSPGRELSALGRQLVAARQALAILEKEGSA
jgi:hypothetical protein